MNKVIVKGGKVDCNLIHGEALEEMDKLIAQGVQVDAIICDPPYGTTACSWDSVIPFEPMWERLNKLIKPNGTIVLFGSEPFSSYLRLSNIKNYKYDWIWNKERGVGHLLTKQRPLKITENIMIFYKSLAEIKQQSVLNFIDLRLYFKKLYRRISKSKKEIINIIGNSADHCFRYESLQWGLPTEQTYNTIIDTFNLSAIEGYLFYDQLIKIYRIEEVKLGSITYNPQMKPREKARITRMKNTKNTCYGDLKDYNGIKLVEKYPINLITFNKSGKNSLHDHPTQKPVKLMEYLIKTYTNENETVLDFTMGSGTTGVACKLQNRNFIGIELDKKYFNIAKKRIKETRVQSEIQFGN